MIEVTVSRLGLDASTNSYVVVLQERGGTRLLPIWIGQPEAESIVMHMHSVKRARPLTHDLFKSLLLGLSAQLRRVQITRVEKSTYYAELHVQRENTLVQIDARPSDSIAIALRLGAPIFASDALLVEPDVVEAVEASDDEAEDDLTPDFSAPSPVEAGEEDTGPDHVDATELSAEQLKSYLENLLPEDFGKFNP
jgi:bifunctional DNase/RNase